MAYIRFGLLHGIPIGIYYSSISNATGPEDRMEREKKQEENIYLREQLRGRYLTAKELVKRRKRV
jgi:hypothetical protein